MQNKGSYFKTEKVNAHITRIKGIIGENMYLIRGTEKALLIDTGCGIGNIHGFVRTLTDLPVQVVVTHGHYDHCGGMYTFDQVFLNRRERARTPIGYSEEKIRNMIRDRKLEVPEKEIVKIRPIRMMDLEEGMAFMLGGLTVETLSCPGHTVATMCMLIKEDRILLTGDACHSITYLHFDDCLPVETYKENLERLQKREKEWDSLLLSHSIDEAPKSMIPEMISRCDEILQWKGNLHAFDQTGFHFVNAQPGQTAQLLFDIRRIRPQENRFVSCGYDADESRKKLEQAFQQMFYGEEDVRVYHPAGEGMAYIEDTGNEDVRTEGMSYGMMVCVQLDKQEEFDRLWKWVKTYMWMQDGKGKGYFAWSCRTDGTRRADGPAPDGEEYFAMALLFASHRWGDRDGIFCYSREAKQILSVCLHHEQPMWNRRNHLILFVPGCSWTDPSYHLPHFYELFSLWTEQDSAFWKKAADASRRYVRTACHPVTGLSPEYAEFDGKPHGPSDGEMRHDWFYSDAYRTAPNAVMDHSWFSAGTWAEKEAARLQDFFYIRTEEEREKVYTIEGKELQEKVKHPLGLLASLAECSLVTGGEKAQYWIKKIWDAQLRRGKYRYYDNFLYIFALLALNGEYQIR